MEHEERLKAALADRYAIEREIGSGGMATVYLATDIRHERKVALKVLRPDLAASLGSERFLQEVRVTANLQHPHILPLFDSGEADGFLFYVMPYIEGESLRERLVREHELPVPAAARLLRDVVDALAAAHKLGVVHRDIKPENVLISGRHAMVADFGVAKAVSEATGRHQLTTLGVALGTPSYMAPEQAAADEAIDHRADLYAVGAMAYELLTGRPPFTGGTPQQVLAAQVMEAPQPVTELRASVPPALETLIMRCLEKKPADRWQSAEEILPHLEAAATPSGGITPTDIQPVTRPSPPIRRRPLAWLAGAVALAVLVVGYFVFFRVGGEVVEPVEGRIAVLPPENQTGDPALDVLGNAAGDWVTDGLARAELVQVVPFTDVLAASSTGREEGGRTSLLYSDWPFETGATLAVLGAIYATGDSIQFRLRIVDREGAVLATVEPVSGPRDNPSEALNPLQMRVVNGVANLVSPDHLLTWSTEGKSPPSPEAHEAYLEGVIQFAIGPQSASLPHFLRALELDPDYMAPLNMLTSLYYNLGRLAQMDSVRQVLESRSDELVERQRLATRMDCVTIYGDVREALRLARLMAESWSVANYRVGLHAKDLLRPNEAVEAFAKYDPEQNRFALEWADANFNQWTQAYYMLGKHEEELEVVRAGREYFPDGFKTAETRALIALGRAGKAEQIVEDRLAGLGPGQSPVTILNDAARYFDVHGHSEVARRLWEECLEYYDSRPDEERASSAIQRGRAIRLLYLERNDEAAPFVEALAENNQENLADLGRLGILRARMGNRGEAEEISERLRTWDAPFLVGSNTWWRASISAALGDPEGAVRLLEQAMEEGWRVGIGPFREPFFKPLREHPAFREFLRPKG